ncbi:MAG: transcription elongation factor GreB [Thiobacillaceae bacterium]|nr:transcription elongation factor GreB [Thiobacillaceae bacterium]
MSKAFMRAEAIEDAEEQAPAPLPAGAPNYMTPAGHARLVAELTHLVKVERPELVNVVAWAAGNGDRSENGDYIYGKKRLREIDRRIRYLTKRLESAVVVDPAAREPTDQVFFGATVTVLDEAGEEATYSIVGIDEADPARGRISWISPLARALLKAREGDMVRCQVPGGSRALEIVRVEYRALD